MELGVYVWVGRRVAHSLRQGTAWLSHRHQRVWRRRLACRLMDIHACWQGISMHVHQPAAPLLEDAD